MHGTLHIEEQKLAEKYVSAGPWSDQFDLKEVGHLGRLGPHKNKSSKAGLTPAHIETFSRDDIVYVVSQRFLHCSS